MPTTDKLDIYTRVTNQLIAAIEAGAGKWQMPWHTNGNAAHSPINITTGKPYRGINVISLWASAIEKNYEVGVWGTFKQWLDRGAQVRKGEKSSLGVFWKTSERDDDDSESNAIGRRSRPFLASAFYLFNAAQVDGYTPNADFVPLSEEERIARAETYFHSLGSRVTHGGNSAFYMPSQDRIEMPNFGNFTTPAAYYSTLGHEHCHWTGHASRCDRDLSGRFGTHAYAAEELVAELGAAFLCAQLGIENDPRADHAAYLQGWLKVMKEDSRAIFTAASKAQQAVDCLNSLQSTGTQQLAAE